MIDFNKYFIVGTNSDALHDTMNGMVVGELIRCRQCAYFRPRSVYGNGLCDIHCNGIGDSAVANENDYCAWATPKETEHD